MNWLFLKIFSILSFFILYVGCQKIEKLDIERYKFKKEKTHLEEEIEEIKGGWIINAGIGIPEQ